MIGHTAGPWHARRNEHYWEFGTDEFQLGDVCASQFTDPGREEANARLVASAPDLLAALEAILPDAEGNHFGGPDTLARINAARAAIARAKGEKI